jgi:hypothetical protein
MPRYLPPVADSSAFRTGNFTMGDGRRDYSGGVSSSSSGSTVSSSSRGSK